VKRPALGQPADPATLVDIPALIRAYFDTVPDPSDPTQRVAFGTSGHRGSSFRGARLEAVTFRCRATASTPNPQLTVAAKLTEALPPGSLRPKRPVYWADVKRRLDTPVYDGDRLVPGNRIDGPGIVETLDTTVVVHPGQTLSVDKFSNFALDTGA